MADWTRTLVKIFVPNELQDLVPQVVAALADPGLEADVESGKHGRWLDFSRVIPVAPGLDGEKLTDWCCSNWGTKWQAHPTPPPKIEQADTFDCWDDFPDTTMITYSMTTAWVHPSGVLDALAETCADHGFGFRCWVSYSDGGTQFNPETNSTQTLWDEECSLSVDVEDLPESDLLEMKALGFSFDHEQQQAA